MAKNDVLEIQKTNHVDYMSNVTIHKRLKMLFIISILCFSMISGCTWNKWENILINPPSKSQPVIVDKDRKVFEEIPVVEENKPEQIITAGEYRFETPKSEIQFILWVPFDYDPEYLWPVIFCYHGAGGSATTWPFYQITNGRGFIIIGMNYIPTESNVKNTQWLIKEKSLFFEVLSMVTTRLNIDSSVIFMGGYSQGGYHTTLLGEQILDRLAGFVVLGAGRFFVDHSPPPFDKIKNKPIFIGVGEQDTTHNPRAKMAAKNYENWGAKVTFEEWQGVSHGINTPEFPSKLLPKWLEDIVKAEFHPQKT